jgi:hypothetical protein
MRPRQQTARHRWPALINIPQRSEGAWESCLARNAVCGRGRFLLNGVGATRQGPRCQVLLRRGCNRWCGFRQGDTGSSIGITKGDRTRPEDPHAAPGRLDTPAMNPRTQRLGWSHAGRSVSEAVTRRCATRATRSAIEDDESAGTLPAVSNRQGEASSDPANPTGSGGNQAAATHAATHDDSHGRHGRDIARDRKRMPMHSRIS